MAKANTNDAYNWANANIRVLADSKNVSVERLDTYMSNLLGKDYLAIWDYFDVCGYIVDGIGGHIIVKDDETGEFAFVQQKCNTPCCSSLNDWVIEHHGRGNTVFVIIAG